MTVQDDSTKAVDNVIQKQEYAAPAVISAVKVTDVVRGGTGFASDGGNFLPL